MISHAEALIHEDYSKIPHHLLAAFYGYVDRKENPGHFLIAVLSNNLLETVSRADKESYAALREIVSFVHMEIPTACHGSTDVVANWLFPKPHRYAGPGEEVKCVKCGQPAAFPAAVTIPYICTTCQ